MHLRSLKRVRGEVSLYDPIGVDREGNEITLVGVTKRPLLSYGGGCMLITETSAAGSVTARVEGAFAWLPARYVTGAPDAVAPLVLKLAERLRAEHGVSELRAPAPTAALHEMYLERCGMAPWCEVVSYRREPHGSVPPFRSAALIRAAGDGDRAALLGLGTNPDRQGRWSVAELDGVVVGYTYSHLDEAGGQFRSMLVDPACRRRSIGWDLACDVLDWFEALGVIAHLRTESDNVAARRLYETLGFQFVEQTPFLCLRFAI